MIYLFEDRKQRMEQFLPKDIDTTILCIDRFIDCEPDEAEKYLETQFSDADCVIIHKSYQFPKNGLTPDTIRMLFNRKGIPVVIFSGDLSSDVLAQFSGGVNADMNSLHLYTNLNTFVETYKDTGHINIPILAFGPMYIINSMMLFQIRVQAILFDHSDSDVLSDDDVDEIRDCLAAIKEPELLPFKESIKSLAMMDGTTVSVLLSSIQSEIDEI